MTFRIGAVALLALSVSATQAPQVFRGTAVDALTGQPLANVVVRLDIANTSGPRPSTPTRVTTGSSGEFVLPLPGPGLYALTGTRAGYSPSNYGQKTIQSPAVWLPIAITESRQGLVLRMWPVARIGGVVRDETGTPIPNARVQLLRLDSLGARPYFLVSASRVTDGDGRYEYELSSGTFVVATAPVVFTNPTAPAIFYPGVPAISLAARFELRPGDQHLAIDFVRRLVAGGVVKGRIDGVLPPGELQLQLVRAEPYLPDSSISIATSIVDKDGRFTFPPVVPGPYVIRGVLYPTWDKSKDGEPELNGGSGPVTLPGQPAHVLGVPTDEPTVWLEAPVTVPPLDVAAITEISPRLQPGVRVAGRIEFVGTTPAPDPAVFPTRAVSVNSLERRFSDVFIAPRIESDRTFRTVGMPPGRYQVGMTQSFPGWTLQSIRSGATEILGRGIDLSSDVSDVVITFTDKPTRLIGSITDGQNALARDARLVIFPVDDSFWTVTGSRLASRVRVVAPTPPPSFAVTLWPGTYFVAAVTGDLPESWETPEFLRSLVPSAVRVTVEPGSTSTVNPQAKRLR